MLCCKESSRSRIFEKTKNGRTAAVLPARMQSTRGKPRNNPQGKLAFSLGISPAFLRRKPILFITLKLLAAYACQTHTSKFA